MDYSAYTEEFGNLGFTAVRDGHGIFMYLDAGSHYAKDSWPSAFYMTSSNRYSKSSWGAIFYMGTLENPNVPDNRDTVVFMSPLTSFHYKRDDRGFIQYLGHPSVKFTRLSYPESLQRPGG